MKEISLKEEPKVEFDPKSPSFLFIKEEPLDIKYDDLNGIKNELEHIYYSEKLDTPFKTEIDENGCVKQELSSEIIIKDEISNEEFTIFTQAKRECNYRRRMQSIKKRTWLRGMFKRIDQGLLTFNRKTAITGGSTSSKYQCVTSSRNESVFCYFCMKPFLIFPQFWNHCIRRHLVVKMSTPRNNLKCDNYASNPRKKSLQCDTNWERYLKLQMNLYTGLKPFKSGICSKEFARRGTLNRHMKPHKGVEHFKCHICSKEFTLGGNLKAHMTLHTKAFKCAITQKSTLKEHMKVHTGIKPFKCDICSKEFTFKGALSRHLISHSGVKSFKCDICSKEFTKIRSINEHVNIHMGMAHFKCDICSKEFTQKAYLRKHMKVHTGIKPFKCDICSKEFTLRGTLNRHMTVHSCLKAFKCDICLKQYGLKGSLKKHLILHTGVKSFECDICLKEFTFRGHLKRHMKLHMT